MYGNSENRGKIQICSRRLKKSSEKFIVKGKIGKVIHEFENLKQGENTSLSQRGWTPLVRPTRSFHVFGPSLWNRLSPPPLSVTLSSMVVFSYLKSCLFSRCRSTGKTRVKRSA